MDNEIIDISVFVDKDLVVWPGNDSIEFKKVKSLESGDLVNDTDMYFNIHSGTHIDAPLHHLKNGDSVEKVSLDTLIGETYVVFLPGVNKITADLLEKKSSKIGETKRILFKTDNSLLWEQGDKIFNEDFAALTECGAKWIVDKRINLVGIDYLSIQRFQNEPEVHKILFNDSIVILEGINLTNVNEGRYHLVCLPVKFKDVEAAPVRAILYSIGEGS